MYRRFLRLFSGVEKNFESIIITIKWQFKDFKDYKKSQWFQKKISKTMHEISEVLLTSNIYSPENSSNWYLIISRRNTYSSN